MNTHKLLLLSLLFITTQESFGMIRRTFSRAVAASHACHSPLCSMHERYLREHHDEPVRVAPFTSYNLNEEKRSSSTCPGEFSQEMPNDMNYQGRNPLLLAAGVSGVYYCLKSNRSSTPSPQEFAVEACKRGDYDTLLYLIANNLIDLKAISDHNGNSLQAILSSRVQELMEQLTSYASDEELYHVTKGELKRYKLCARLVKESLLEQ